MGTDIHLYVEKLEDGKWVSCDEWEERSYGLGCKHIYTGRNYKLFAILANVRNNFGFAGINMGEELIPISEPRGFPEDASPEVKRTWKEWGEHTPSWLLVSEILGFDWDVKVRNRGVISGVQYAALVDAREIYKDEYKELVKPAYGYSGAVGGKLAEERGYQEVFWVETYKQCCDDFWLYAMPKLLVLGPPDEVRIVFWFDS